MTENERVGINMFFKLLRKEGLFEKYMRNYMEYHEVTSPKMVPEVLCDKASKRFDKTWGRLKTPRDFFFFLASHFAFPDISFHWGVNNDDPMEWCHRSAKLKESAKKL